MQKALAAIMNRLIDYAGLFPPAALPLDPAIRNYHRYRTDQDEWMLGRFILPCGKFDQVEPYLKELFFRQPLRVSALGLAGKSVDESFQLLESDIAAIEKLQRDFPKAARVEVFETRVPLDPPNTPRLIAAIAGLRSLGIAPFVEVAFSPNDLDRLAELIAQIAAHEGVGFKLRCGGTEASAFPSIKQVAFAIGEATTRGVPMKFTAGLHHPIRHFNDSVNTKMHGFLNVFVAALLAAVRGVGHDDIVRILEIESADAFRFSDGRVEVLSFELPTHEIEQLRRERVTSFGSCSFDEPRDDLRSLGWT